MEVDFGTTSSLYLQKNFCAEEFLLIKFFRIPESDESIQGDQVTLFILYMYYIYVDPKRS